MFERNNPVMTYSVLMEIAMQREEQVAARSRLPRLDVDGSAETTRRTRKHGRNGLPGTVLSLMSRT